MIINPPASAPVELRLRVPKGGGGEGALLARLSLPRSLENGGRGNTALWKAHNQRHWDRMFPSMVPRK